MSPSYIVYTLGSARVASQTVARPGSRAVGRKPYRPANDTVTAAQSSGLLQPVLVGPAVGRE